MKIGAILNSFVIGILTLFLLGYRINKLEADL
jgi:hypothetical protein